MFNRLPERDTDMKTWIQRTLVASAAAVLVGSLAACSSGFASESAPASGHASHAQHGTMAQHGGMHGGMHGNMHGSKHGEGHMAQRQGKMLERMASRLDLDETQKQKLAALATQMQAQRQAMMGGMKPARHDMLALLSGPTFDQARAQALVQEKTQQMQAQAPQLIAAMADFYDSLRPEQQAQVREFAQSRAERWGRGEGKRHGDHHSHGHHGS
jgi:periplasmic protein CpxP/Spy